MADIAFIWSLLRIWSESDIGHLNVQACSAQVSKLTGPFMALDMLCLIELAATNGTLAHDHGDDEDVKWHLQCGSSARTAVVIWFHNMSVPSKCDC